MGFLQFLSGTERQLNPFDNGKTFKNTQGNTSDTRSAGKQVLDTGFNFLKSAVQLPVQFSENWSNTFANLGARAAGGKNQTIEKNMGTDPLNRAVLHFSGATGTNKQLAADAAQVGLTAVAPAIGKGFGFLAPSAPRLVTAPLTGAAFGAPYNALSTAGEGGTKSDIAKAGLYGGLFGAVTGGAAEAIHAGAPKVSETVKDVNAKLTPLNEVGAIGRNLSPDELTKLKSATTVGEVQSTLKDVLPQSRIDEIAPAIVRAKDGNVITNLVYDRALPSPSEVNPTAVPTPVGGGAITAGQGSLALDSTVPRLSTANAPKISSTESVSPTAPVEPPAPAVVSQSPQQTILDALNGKPAAKGESPITGVRTLAQQQKSMLSQERGQRFAAAQNAGEGLSGTEAHVAELKQLAGRYKKVEWSGLADRLGGPKAAEDVYAQLRSQIKQDKSLTYTDGLNTDIALRKLILGEGLPTAGDIKRLENVFSPQEIEQITRHVGAFQQAKNLTAQLIGTPRAIMASGDVSFGGRQALAYATAHPVEFGKQWLKQFQYFKEGLKSSDAEALTKAYTEIKAHPDFQLAKDAGLAITDFAGHNPSSREEQFIAGNLAEKIPGIGRLVRGSDHAFTGLANNIRANSFYSLIEQARQADYNVDLTFAKDIARVVNNGTGRGSVKALEKHMGTLSTALFAPRLMLSRLQTFAQVFDPRINPVARKEAVRQLVSLSTFAIATLGIAKAAGLGVNLDPTNSDFGKVKVGDTRVDFLGGYSQYVRLGAQLIEGKTTSSITGKESQLGSGYGQKSRKDILYSFLENKENPVASFITEHIKGTDISGNNVNNPKGWLKSVTERVTPLLFQDLNDLRTHPNSNKNVGLDIAAPFLGATGAGLQTYGTQDIQLSGKNKDYVDKLKKSGASQDKVDAATEFFQASKTGPDRTKYADQIKAALQKGDEQQAIALAKKYNDEYAATFKDWNTKYGKYRNDKALVKEYISNRITSNSLIRWDDAIKNPQ